MGYLCTTFEALILIHKAVDAKQNEFDLLLAANNVNKTRFQWNSKLDVSRHLPYIFQTYVKAFWKSVLTDRRA